jgi:hypothetical protein
MGPRSDFFNLIRNLESQNMLNKQGKKTITLARIMSKNSFPAFESQSSDWWLKIHKI